jgi:hypothetical protein
MTIDFDKVYAFLEKHAGRPIVAFGFTFIVWIHFILALRNAGRSLPMNNCILIHSGGWKKLEQAAVDNSTFKRALRETTGVARVHNFYGMVEQVGSIFVECEEGHLHAPMFADVIIRDPIDWSPCPVDREGVVQVVSIIPRSYPGHALLTEDRGVLLGEDNCDCGRKGRFFKVLGRLPMAEVRGCSDTYAMMEPT